MPDIQTVSDLTPDPKNARAHSARNIETIVDSLNEVGTGRSIVIDEDGVILAGNATVEAARRAGKQRVQVVEADGDTIIAVRRTGLTPDQKARLALADNRANELSEFDPAILAELQAEGVSLSGLWSADELDNLLAGLEVPELSAPAASPSSGSKAYDPLLDDVTPRAAAPSTGAALPDRQESEVSPRPPAASGANDAPPPSEAAPLLDRVAPDQETARNGLFVHLRGLKIPLSPEEDAALAARMADYRERVGTFYGFIGSLLSVPNGTSNGTNGPFLAHSEAAPPALAADGTEADDE